MIKQLTYLPVHIAVSTTQNKQTNDNRYSMLCLIGSPPVASSRQPVHTKRRDGTGSNWMELILKCSEPGDWMKN
jgi:hypothetical protein